MPIHDEGAAPAGGSLPSGTMAAALCDSSAGKNATGSSSSIVNSVAEWMWKPASSVASPSKSAFAPRTDE